LSPSPVLILSLLDTHFFRKSAHLLPPLFDSFSLAFYHGLLLTISLLTLFLIKSPPIKPDRKLPSARHDLAPFVHPHRRPQTSGKIFLVYVFFPTLLFFSHPSLFRLRTKSVRFLPSTVFTRLPGRIVPHHQCLPPALLLPDRYGATKPSSFISSLSNVTPLSFPPREILCVAGGPASEL